MTGFDEIRVGICEDKYLNHTDTKDSSWEAVVSGLPKTSL